jgi:formate hydrogenlyase subunit 6/NADH:ubiquinone oxidoreductase subunit I
MKEKRERVVVQCALSKDERGVHHRDTEDTEGAQRKSYQSLCVLCALCVSVVNCTVFYIQDQSNAPAFYQRLITWMTS